MWPPLSGRSSQYRPSEIPELSEPKPWMKLLWLCLVIAPEMGGVGSNNVYALRTPTYFNVRFLLTGDSKDFPHCLYVPHPNCSKHETLDGRYLQRPFWTSTQIYSGPVDCLFIMEAHSAPPFSAFPGETLQYPVGVEVLWCVLHSNTYYYIWIKLVLLFSRSVLEY